MTDVEYPAYAMEVANWFLQKGWSDPEKPPCDQMKINKLVFYAHGWYMGNGHIGLFPEDVEAWPHGPVIRDLYIEFRRYGRAPIPNGYRGKSLKLQEGKVVFVTHTYDGTLNDFFERVWDAYGGYTGVQLSNMTHHEGEAWTIVAEQYGFDLEGKPTIPPAVIKEVFRRKVENVRRDS